MPVLPSCSFPKPTSPNIPFPTAAPFSAVEWDSPLAAPLVTWQQGAIPTSQSNVCLLLWARAHLGRDMVVALGLGWSGPWLWWAAEARWNPGFSAQREGRPRQGGVREGVGVECVHRQLLPASGSWGSWRSPGGLWDVGSWLLCDREEPIVQDGSPERDLLPSGDLSGVFLTKSQWLLNSVKPVAGVTCIRTLGVSQGRAVGFRVICSASGLCPPSRPRACAHGAQEARVRLCLVPWT